MLKEIEKRGITIVQIANLVPVAFTVGSNRIVPGISIPYPLGDPNTTEKEQWDVRYSIVNTALNALTTDIEEQTVFKVKE